ncbi:hypothetical protein JOF54_000190 [Microlunatus capsulatus]|uniref:Uncharacterized protein n=1 Tax=Microlunatus capsulatus TaxID=99117 RepID=A0ABS4Z2J1_9ACTN|nr:hypothetical protein [Microlunatus capsulatus]
MSERSTSGRGGRADGLSTPGWISRATAKLAGSTGRP